MAVSSTHGVGGVTDGATLATAFHADLQGKTTFASLGVRFDPAGFQTLTGQTDPGMSADLSVRRHTDRFGDFDLDLGHTDDRSPGSTSDHENHATLSGGKSWGKVNAQYVLGLDNIRSDGTSSLQRTGAVTFTEQLKSLSLFETYQATSTSATSGFAGQRQIAVGVSRQLFGGTAAYQFSRNNADGGGGSLGDGSAQSLSYRRAVGRKLDAQVSESIQKSNNNGVPTNLYETTVSLVRRLSSVVALQVSGDVFRQTGFGGGSGSGIQASLVGPFGFGQPRQTIGRSNPNVPAVIRGTVTYSYSSTPFAYNAPTPRGFNNALIILDGKITQRTDASGEFEFRFVPQGTHTIRIDSATIPPGLIADREYQSVTVQGGQTTSIEFNVGNFAGVGGTVVVRDPNGTKRGLPGVGIAIDGIQATSTTPDGHFSVGHLSPGAHTVEIVETTLPSTVAFVSDKKKTVTVTPGVATPVEFVATPLGSIGGNVVAPADGGFGQMVGLKNVYVVAEPGEHAAITDDDGNFLLDNMPPGSYTLTIDQDTIPDGMSLLSGPDGPLSVEGGASVSGLIFKLGAGAKNVVFTFNEGKRQPIQVTVDPAMVPPGAHAQHRGAHLREGREGALRRERCVRGVPPPGRPPHGRLDRLGSRAPAREGRLLAQRDGAPQGRDGRDGARPRRPALAAVRDPLPAALSRAGAHDSRLAQGARAARGRRHDHLRGRLQGRASEASRPRLRLRHAHLGEGLAVFGQRGDQARPDVPAKSALSRADTRLKR